MNLSELVFIPFIISLSTSMFPFCLSDYKFGKMIEKYSTPTDIVNSCLQESKIGKGRYGTIFETKWGDGVAAVKVITAVEGGADIDNKSSQARELIVFHRLNNKDVTPKFYGCLQRPEHLYLVQEKLYADLTEIGDGVALKFKALPPIKRLEAYKIIASKVMKLHQVGFTHQDLKPANIMVANKDFSDFRLIDFGLSKFIGRGYANGGSPFYNSEDKIKDVPIASVSHDIYALAMTIAVLETSLNAIFQDIPKPCFLVEFTPECKNKLRYNLNNSFESSDIPGIHEVISKGINLSESNYKSMKDLKNAIDDVIKQGVKVPVQNIENESDTKDRIVLIDSNNELSRSREKPGQFPDNEPSHQEILNKLEI